MDPSKLRIRAGMAAVSALLLLSPVVISAAGSIANPAAQENTGISDSGRTVSTCRPSEDDGGAENAAADTGSTLAADPQSTGALPSCTGGEVTESNESSTTSADATDDKAQDENKDGWEEDADAPDAGGVSKEEESKEGGDLEGTDTSQSAAGRDDSSESPDAADEEDAGNADGTDAGNGEPDGDADAANAADDGSVDHEDGDGAGAGKTSGTGVMDSDASGMYATDGEASGMGVADPESTEDSKGQGSKQENENVDVDKDEDENSAAFGIYGSNDFAGAITPEIIRIPADEWEAYGGPTTVLLEREKEFFSAGTPVFFDLKGAEYSAAVLDDRFELEKTEDGTAAAIEAASVKDGTGVYENVVEYIFRNAGSTPDGEKADLVLTLDEARIELPEDSGEEASGKIAVSSVSDDHVFRAEARSIPAGEKDNAADRANEADAADVRVSEKWSARITWHEGDDTNEGADVAEPRALIFISDLDKVFGDPSGETCDRERAAMLSGFTGKAFCREDSTISVSASGYLEGNGQPDTVILPADSASIQFAWGGTNCSAGFFTGFDGTGPDESAGESSAESSEVSLEESSGEKTPDKEDPANPENAADLDAAAKAETNAEEAAISDTEETNAEKAILADTEETNAEEAILADTEESLVAPMSSRAAILIRCTEEPGVAASLSAGDTAEFSMEVKNSGSEILTDVEVSEILDDDAELSVAWDRSSDPDTGENILSEGETVPVTVAYTVTQDDIDAGKLIRRTEASAQTADRGTVADEQASEVILRGTASIGFSKRASVQQISDAKEGASIQYFFTVTNSGDVTLRNIEVIDQMEGLSPIEYDWDGSTDGMTGEGVLSPGERVTASASYEITSDDISNGRIVNKAYARGETLQGETIESSQPEAPTTVSQEGKEESPSGSPATGDDTDILIFLVPAVVSLAVLITSYAIEKKQRKKMSFDIEEED